MRTGRPRSSPSRPSTGPWWAPVRCGSVVDAAAVNFPDVLLVAGEYQIKVPPPFVPGSEFAGVVAEVGRRRRRDRGRRPGLRERDGRCVRGADRRTGGVAHAGARTVSTRGSRPRSASRIAPPTTCCVRWPGSAPATTWSCSVPAAASGSRRCSSRRCSARRVTAVASSDEKLAAAAALGAVHLRRPPCGGPAQQLRAALPDGADVVVDPVGGDLAEPALRALRYDGRFVTVGYASGTIPRIPLNLVLLKGIRIVGFEMLRFMQHHRDEIARERSTSCSRCSPPAGRSRTSARRSRSTTRRPRCATWPTVMRSARCCSTSGRVRGRT